MYGTYVFEETKAPPTFIRNTGITIRQIHQNVEPTDIDETNHGDAENVAREELDSKITRSITVNKKIHDTNYYEPFGNPTAIFKCEGDDVLGNHHIYYKSVTLDAPKLLGRYYKGSVTFNDLPAGEYTITEEDTMRYKVKEITEVSENGLINSESVRFELVNHANGTATYENEISRWDNYSDTECVVNVF